MIIAIIDSDARHHGAAALCAYFRADVIFTIFKGE